MLLFISDVMLLFISDVTLLFISDVTFVFISDVILQRHETHVEYVHDVIITSLMILVSDRKKTTVRSKRFSSCCCFAFRVDLYPWKLDIQEIG